MHKILFTLTTFLFTATGYGQPEKKLAEAFIQSVAKNNFQLLTPYLLNSSEAKKLYGAEFNKMSPAKQTEAIKNMKTRLQDKWSTVVSNAKASGIDFSKLSTKLVLTAPLEGNPWSNSLLVTYQYNGKEWDDLVFIVNKTGTSRYIIEMPSNTSMFTLDEGRIGKNINDFSLRIDRNDPMLKQRLIESVVALKKYANDKDTLQLYKRMVYRGEEDKDSRWKRTVDPSRPEDVTSSQRLLERSTVILNSCNDINYGDVKTEKESEGVWYIITATCRDKKIVFAFLKIDNVFVLGDMD